LTARVRAALRRRAGAEPFVLGDLTIDYEQRRVSVAGRAVRLTATEFELARVLSVNAGRVLTCDSLLRQVWARRESANVMLLRSVMKRLRQKLGDKAARPAYIFTEREVRGRLPHAATKRHSRVLASDTPALPQSHWKLPVWRSNTSMARRVWLSHRTPRASSESCG